MYVFWGNYQYYLANIFYGAGIDDKHFAIRTHVQTYKTVNLSCSCYDTFNNFFFFVIEISFEMYAYANVKAINCLAMY